MARKAPSAPAAPNAGMTDAVRIRSLALELAIRAAPHLIPTNLDRVTGAQLTAEAEKIEQWLKAAK